MLEDKAILFLSHLIPYECYDEVISYSKKNMQDAANALQWHLVEGFSHNLNKQLDIINFMPVASFPKYYKKAWIKEHFFDANTRTPAVNIGFCNIKYVRRTSIARSLWDKINTWCEDNRNKNKTIIIYTLNPIVLDVLAKIKEKFSDILFCAIVADLPDMINLSTKKGFIRRVVEKRISASAYSNLEIVDKFVFLTEQMSDYIGNTKPYCVMEGISTDFVRDTTTNNEKSDADIKTVLYTGTLHRKFGVLHLLQAFMQIDDMSYRLVICGVGDSENEIHEAAKKDPRIIFKGQCSRGEVLQLQRSATVLVNPRMNNEEFTKYSFPSKNMEYLSSGTPLVAYKLDGIPDEYDSYINYVPDNTLKSLASAIVFVSEMSPKQRNVQGQAARSFVLEKKNSIAQTKRIIQLIFN